MGDNGIERLGADSQADGPQSRCGTDALLKALVLAASAEAPSPSRQSVPQIIPDWLVNDRTTGTGVDGTVDGSPMAVRRHLSALRRRLRRERAMARCGHWAYDLSRHLALSRMVKSMEGRLTYRPDQDPPAE